MTSFGGSDAHGLTVLSSRPDPAIGEFFELRLALARIGISTSEKPERLEGARRAMSEIGRDAKHAIRRTDVRRADDTFAGVCHAAWSEVAEGRRLLEADEPTPSELVLARRALYRGLCLVAEALSATSAFATFVTQVVAASRANPEDIAWALEVGDAELGVAEAHPRFCRVSADNQNRLRSLREEIAVWRAGERRPDTGQALLNRLILLVDCLKH